jgi:hypothetical protein
MKINKRRLKGCCVRRDLRLAIYLRDRFTCLYCGRDLHNADPQHLTLDHLRCQINGGHNGPSNLITACRACNLGRQTTPWTEYATVGAKQRIRRHRKRSITRYRALAQQLLGEGHRVHTIQQEDYHADALAQ